MKIRFPFWEKISDGVKQFLAIVAVAQAIVFCISIPYGIYSEWNFIIWMDEQPSYTPEGAAYLEIINELYTNSTFYNVSYAYIEACNEYPPVRLGSDVCSELLTLDALVNKWASEFKLSDDALEMLKHDLAIRANLPIK